MIPSQTRSFIGHTREMARRLTLKPRYDGLVEIVSVSRPVPR